MGAWKAPGLSRFATVPYASGFDKWRGRSARNPAVLGYLQEVGREPDQLLLSVPGRREPKVDIAADRAWIDVVATLGVRTVQPLRARSSCA